MTIADVIGDDEGLGASAKGYMPGSVALVVDGAGQVILSASNSYSGGTEIEAGTLELAAPNAAGSSPVTFTGAPASLVVDAGASLILPNYYHNQAPGATAGTAIGAGGTGDSVVNSGTINAGTTQSEVHKTPLVGGVGVAVGAGETLTNASTGLIVGGQGGGVVGGLYMTGGAASNAGSIEGSGGSQGDNGNIPEGGPGVFMSGGALSNTGLIAGGPDGYNLGAGQGVILSGPAQLINSGAVSGGAGISTRDNAGVTETFTSAAGAAGVQIENGATVVNLSSGSIAGGASGLPGGAIEGAYVDGGTLDTAGTISGGAIVGGGFGDAVDLAGDSDRLIVRPGAVFNGAVVASGTADLLELGAPATGHAAGVLGGVGSAVTGFSTAQFDPGAAWTLGGGVAGLGAIDAITGFESGDIIDATDLTTSAPTATIGAGGLLTIPSTDGGATLTLHFDASYAGDSVDLTPDGVSGTDVSLACFLAGTHILTPRGEVLVETLKAGDLVLTTDGRSVAIRWLGVRCVVSRFAGRLRGFPVRIHAGALAEGVPARDLLVSPDHAMFVDGILAQAGALVNGSSITREASMPDRFTYYHVEVADHALILAEGAPTETFVDNADRMSFDNWAEHETLHGAAPAMAELPYPRAQSARQVPQTLSRKLAARAAALAGSLAIPA